MDYYNQKFYIIVSNTNRGIILPGPTLIYECPNCKDEYAVETMVSGNTFGATIYSDGKMYAHMMIQTTIITQYKSCNTIFWLDDDKIVKEIDYLDRCSLKGDIAVNNPNLNIVMNQLQLSSFFFSFINRKTFMTSSLVKIILLDFTVPNLIFSNGFLSIIF